MQDLWVFVKTLPDTMSAIFPNNGTALAFRNPLDRVADVT